MMNQTSSVVLWIGRIVAVAVAIITGLIVLTDIFFTQIAGDAANTAAFGLGAIISRVGALLVGWAAILFAFALVMGLINVVSVHWHRAYTRRPGGVYSIILLLSLLGTLIVGFISPAGLSDIFEFVLKPLEATLFALLALFIATAAFRAFRVRNLETLVFVIFALIVLLGQVPIGIYLWPELPIIRDWILDVPTLAGVRGILLGVALGTIATGLRVLIGTDRPYTD